MIKYFDSVLRKTGGPYVGVVVTVRLFPSEALAPIYTDDGSGLIPGSTVTTDDLGFFEFFCDVGRYVLDFAVNNATYQTIINVDVGGIQVIEDLASDDVGMGASMVVLEDGTTVQDFVDAAGNPTFTGRVNLIAGAANSTAIGLTGDVNAGMYFPANDSISFSTNASERLNIANSLISAYEVLAGEDGTASTPGYGFTAQSGVGLYRPGTSRLGFAAGGVARGEFDANGCLLINTATSLNIGGVDPALIQVVTEEADSTFAAVNLVTFDTSNSAYSRLRLAKSAGATEGVYTIVANGEQLGSVAACGSDGVDLESIGASLRFIVDGSPAANRIPTKFSFRTSDGLSDDDLTERFAVSANGRLYGTALHNNVGAVTGTTNQYIASGTYTPTLTNTTNIDASDPKACQWTRVGNVVTVGGQFDVDPTSSAAATVLGMSLPIASNFDGQVRLGGASSAVALGVQEAWGIQADPVTDVASFEGYAGTATNHTVSFTFTYLIQ